MSGGKRRLLLTWRPSKKPRLTEDDFFGEGEICCSLQDEQYADEEITLAEEVHSAESFICSVAQCGKEFTSVNSYEFHYNTSHRNRCSVCRRIFPTHYLLDIHVVEWHDSMFDMLAQKQNMYDCLVQNCGEKFSQPTERKEHLIKVHKYPASFRFDKPVKQKTVSKKPVISKGIFYAGETTKADEQQFMKTAGECILPHPSNSESADLAHGNEEQATEKHSSRKYVYKVPKHISFGAGAQKGFLRSGHKKTRKHWHQAEGSTDTNVNIEAVKMDDLASALDT